MQYTTNYDLNQWEAADIVTREDFNADNAKIDAALKSKCEIVTGNYTGNGGARTLSFDGKPLLVFVQPKARYNTVNSYVEAIMLYGTECTYSFGETHHIIPLTWTATSVSWNSSHEHAMNYSGVVYSYAALVQK